jgi:hypothetical protein
VKRLRSPLLNFCVLLSLLICIAATVMWVRSYRVADELSWGRNEYENDGSVFRRFWALGSQRGCIVIDTSRISPPLFPRLLHKDEGFHLSHVAIGFSAYPTSGFWWRLGFAYVRTERPVLSGRTVAIPYWFVTSLLAVVPALWLINRVRRTARISRNCCPTCGYDMRATPGRCPECGTAAPESAGSA